MLITSIGSVALAEGATISVHALAEHQCVGYTLTVKVKYANFEQVTRRQTVTSPLRTMADLQPLLPVLLARTEAGRRPVRLLGLSCRTWRKTGWTRKES